MHFQVLMFEISEWESQHSLISILLYMYICVPRYVHVYHKYAWIGQKRASDLLELEL